MNYLNFFSQQDKITSIEDSNGMETQKTKKTIFKLDGKELQTIDGGGERLCYTHPTYGLICRSTGTCPTTGI